MNEMSDFATMEKNRAYYQEQLEQILRATKERMIRTQVMLYLDYAS